MTDTSAQSTRPAGTIPVLSRRDEDQIAAMVSRAARWDAAGNTRKASEAYAEIDRFRHAANSRACHRVYHKLQWWILDDRDPQEAAQWQKDCDELMALAEWCTAQIKD